MALLQPTRLGSSYAIEKREGYSIKVDVLLNETGSTSDFHFYFNGALSISAPPPL
jgi:hypothetical protein